MSNPYVDSGRLVKAGKMADVLASEGYSASTAAGFTDAQWSLAAAAARVKKPPSVETQQIVIRLLKNRETAGRLSVDQQNRQIEEAMRG